MTPSQARNAIKKALVEIVDPKPKKSEIDDMWKHFSEKCAFCGTSLRREDRVGHADHLIPASKGGHNHIFNRVLACANCNGDSKLDTDWMEFLGQSPGTEDEKTGRRDRIEKWQAQHKAQCAVDTRQIAGALNAAEEAITAFNQACDTVRALRSHKTA